AIRRLRHRAVFCYLRLMRIDIGDLRMFFDVEGAKLRPDGPQMREVPTVVLLHGGPGGDHSGFKPHYGRLADIAQVVYIDHRGQAAATAARPNSGTSGNGPTTSR